MKIFIVTDMEGISGVVHQEQASGDGWRYQEARRWLTEHVNAAVEAADEAGIDEILISDGHNHGRNIVLDMLNPAATLLTGRGGRRFGPMEGIDSRFNAVFMIGLHGREGTRGVLEHTIHGGAIEKVIINGKEIGEIELNAAIAGEFGVPVAMVSGDSTAVRQALDLLPKIEIASVMESMGTNLAKVPAPSKVHMAIKKAAKNAICRIKEMKPFRFEGPVQLEVFFKTISGADTASIMPGVVRAGLQVCTYKTTDLLKAQDALQVIIILACNSK